MKKLLTLLLLTATIGATAQKNQSKIIELDVWEGKQPPHTTTLAAAQSINERGHILNCATARVELYIPEGGADKTIVICPGGGYGALAMEHEGRDFARFLNTKGIAAAVLSYRMPGGVHQIPLEDAKQTFRTLRKFGKKWGLNPRNIGVMGFSAGGHLAATISTRLNPAFSVLFYPVISFQEGMTHGGSRQNLTGGNKDLYDYYSAEKQVTKNTPPALLFHSADDTAVPLANSEVYRDALLAVGQKAELVVYPKGGHGWGFFTNFANHAQMKDKLIEWLNNL